MWTKFVFLFFYHPIPGSSNNKYSGSSGSHSNTSTAAKTNSSGRGSANHLNQIGTFGSYTNKNGSSQGSTTNLSKQFGSSQNLIRSSTTNLSKSNSNRNSFDIKRGFYDMSRSSTTNLSKDRRHGSHLNLLKHQHLRSSNSNVNSIDDISLPVTANNSRSRRNSSTVRSNDSSAKANIPRVPSNSNLKAPSQRRSSVSNIPRASLNSSSFKQQAGTPAGNVPTFGRQTSLQPQPSTSRNSNGARCVSDHFPGRPHTADAQNNGQFEWPKMLFAEKRTINDEPLPSDLEVMVSDVENLVNEDN